MTAHMDLCVHVSCFLLTFVFESMFSHSFVAPRKYYSNPYCPLGSVLMPESVLRNVRAVFEMTVERTTQLQLLLNLVVG